ncbi:MAG: transposase [bacterium]|nr:transposase [bacterium]
MGNRQEVITVGSYVHVCNRGVRRMPIYRQKSDLWRLLFNLFYLNSAHVSENWARELEEQDKDAMKNFVWLEKWGPRVPLVSILAYTIMPNHFHLLLKEVKTGGISRFMHKFSMGYAKFINTKYKESGSLFQGRYRSKTVDDDTYFQHVAAYVMTKNPMELHDGGLKAAMHNFESAWQQAIEYPFSSLAEYAEKRTTPILEKELLGELFPSGKSFKSFSKDCIEGMNLDDKDFDL